MANKTITTRVLAGLTLAGGLFGGQAKAQQSAAALLAREPAQKGVQVTTPAGAELAACKAEEMKWPKSTGGASPTGTEVRDAQGKLLRRFVDTTGRGNPNIVSFYLNGSEAYREIDANGDGKPDQFRWLGANGGKWGEDKNGDGVIDVWHVISPEEVTQELFQVFQTLEPRRLAALQPKEDELKAAGFPPAEIAKIMQRSAAAAKKVQETFDALKPLDKAKWVHVEMGVPQTTPGDAVGSPTDVVVHKNVAVLFDKGDGKTAEVFQVGDLVQVGRAWRLVDGPSAGAGGPGGEGEYTSEVQKLFEQLQKVQPPADPSDRVAVAKYHTDRAAVLQQIVAKLQGAQQETFLKQMVEAVATAAEAGDAAAMTRLKDLQGWASKSTPASVAGFVTFRLVAAEYAAKLGQKDADVGKVQTWWRESLESFLKAYPTAEDAPEAMLRLAMAFEFTGKDGDGPAKTWYENLAKNFPNHAHAAKSQGAIRRLTSEGQPFQLAGAKLGEGAPFNVTALNGKAVVVYYWASWSQGAAAELKQLAELATTYGPKGLAVVTVNLDPEPAKAMAAVNAVQIPGAVHLYAPGGLEGSPLAAAYGIQMVPHVFLVGKNGAVVNKNAQTGPVLKDEIEKLVK